MKLSIDCSSCSLAGEVDIGFQSGARGDLLLCHCPNTSGPCDLGIVRALLALCDRGMVARCLHVFAEKQTSVFPVTFSLSLFM